MTTLPFLTIVTRCCQRPNMLAKNISSVREQSDKQIEQVFVLDREIRGRLWANQRLAEIAQYLHGDYIYILDDDCRLLHPDFVVRVRQMVSLSSADVVMVKTSRPQQNPKILPRWEGWAKPKHIRGKQVNCLCYVVRAGLWKETIRAFGSGVSGAARFFDTLLKFNPSMVWLPILAAETLQLGRDGGFEDVKGTWPDDIVRQHSMQFLDDDVWAIYHWR